MTSDRGSGFEPIRDDDALDGNAAAGLLAGVFGRDVTADLGRCGHCGTVNHMAALRAYLSGPGAVLRCPACSSVVLVVVERASGPVVDRSAWRD